jgi:glutamine amidotransferase
MCRALVYLGEPVLLDNLLFQPESSLIKQAYMPRMLRMLNLGGFGVMAWDRGSHRPETPFRYVVPNLPVFDRNLKNLAEKLKAECVLAHVRGVRYSTTVNISPQDSHPFCYDGFKIALAHNGDLHRIGEMKGDLLQHMRPEIARLIAGSTDSEWLYALLLSQLEDPWGLSSSEELLEAVERSLAIIRDIRARLKIATSSSVNLFISNGLEAIGVRYCFDFGCYPVQSPESVQETNLTFLSLWYTTGRSFGLHEGEWKMIGGEQTANSMIISSEPLTHDTATWLEVPEYSAVHGALLGDRPVVGIRPLAA